MKRANGASLNFFLPDWLRSPVLPYAVAKELRVLVPIWVSFLGMIILGPVLLEDAGQFFIIVGYFLGCSVMGAVAFGHEYTHHTLNSLLAQPVSRERIWLTKMGVLVPLLLLLGLAAGLVASPGNSLSIPFRTETWRDPNQWMGVMYALIPLLNGILVAPWLTMLCRSPLAGAVFTITLPWTLMVAAVVVSLVRFGGDIGTFLPERNEFTEALFCLGLLVQWALAGWLGWRTFMRLQSIEGPGTELGLPSWLRRRPSAKAVPASERRHPLRLLVAKELRLHQLEFLLAGVVILAWIATWAMKQTQPLMDVEPIVFVVMFYAALIPVLAGCLASAEERQMGTLEWQTLLPMAAAHQWLVKAGMVLGVTWGLGLALPYALSVGLPLIDILGGPNGAGWPFLAGAQLLLAVLGLYISSVSRGGLHALMVTIPLGMVSLTLLGWLGDLIQREMFPGQNLLGAVFDPNHMSALQWLSVLWPVAVIGVLLAMALRFGLGNHRSAECGWERASRQVLAMAAVAIVAELVWLGLAGLALAEKRAGIDAQVAWAEEMAATKAQARKRVLPAGNDPRLLREYGLTAGALNPTTNQVNLWASLGAFCRDQTATDKPLPQSITLNELITQRYAPEVLTRAFGSLDQSIKLSTTTESDPYLLQVVTARLPDGQEMPVFQYTARVANRDISSVPPTAAGAMRDTGGLASLGGALSAYYRAHLQNVVPLPATTVITLRDLVAEGFLQEADVKMVGGPETALALTGVNGTRLQDRSLRARLPDGRVITVFADGSVQIPPHMDQRMMMRYGLLPRGPRPSAPAPVPSGMSPEMKQRYGLGPPESTSPTTPSTNALPVETPNADELRSTGAEDP